MKHRRDFRNETRERIPLIALHSKPCRDRTKDDKEDRDSQTNPTD